MVSRKFATGFALFVTSSILFACSGSSDSAVSSDDKGNEIKGGGDQSANTGATPATSASGSEATPPTCNATTCATGCCISNQCFSDRTADHCATGGVACPAACATGSACSVQADQTLTCSAPLSGKYQIILVKASIHPEGGAPNPYVNGGQVGTLDIHRGETKGGTNEPQWNQVVGQADVSALVGATVHIEVKDDVTFFDGTLGNCTHRISATEVAAKQAVIVPPECDSKIQSFTMSFIPVH